MEERVVIVDSVRTGLAKSFRGEFNQTRADDMLTHLIDALLVRNPSLDPGLVEDVVVGCGLPEASQGNVIGRSCVALSQLPITVSGMTVNRYCASGLQSIVSAANQINSGYADVIMAGGVESISMVQKVLNMNQYFNNKIQKKVPGIYHTMLQTAETVASRYGVSREAQDEYAYQSQMRTAKAQQQGLFDDEIIPMETVMTVIDKVNQTTSQQTVVCDKDSCNRVDTTLEGLAKLKPVLKADGFITAGNASQMADGASMTLVMRESTALKLGLKPLLVFKGFVSAGCEPDEMGIGPIFAIPKLLKKAGLSIDDIDCWELNEAFASQVVYVRDKLGLPMDRLNVNGGSIAIGHPYGMTGSRLVGHLARELNRRQGRYGVVTMCVGGGQGAAGLFEAYKHQ